MLYERSSRVKKKIFERDATDVVHVSKKVKSQGEYPQGKHSKKGGKVMGKVTQDRNRHNV